MSSVERAVKISKEKDRERMPRLQNGDMDAWAEVYRDYFSNIRDYIRSKVSSDEIAADLTQDAFIKLAIKAETYKPREGSFLFAWLLAVARNTVADYYGQASVRRVIHLEDPSFLMASDFSGNEHEELSIIIERSIFTGEDSADQHDDSSALIEVLRGLPVMQRQVLFDRHVRGLSTPEIAEKMERSIGSIHHLHHRARRTAMIALAERGVAPAARNFKRRSRRVGRVASIDTITKIPEERAA